MFDSRGRESNRNIGMCVLPVWEFQKYSQSPLSSCFYVIAFLYLPASPLPPSLIPHSPPSPCSLTGGNIREDGNVQKAAGSFTVSRLGTGLYEVVVGDGPKTER